MEVLTILQNAKKNLGNKRLKFFLLISIICSVSFSILSICPLSDVIDMQIARRLEFSFRNLVKNEPTLSPKIKIIAFDDTSAQKYGAEAFLPAGDWAQLFTLLDAAKPSAILVDKLFGKFANANDALLLSQNSIKITTPIYCGASVFPSKIAGWQPLASKLLSHTNVNKNNIDSHVFRVAYGPEPQAANVFTLAGHLNIEEHGLVYPFKWINNDSFLPALGLVWNPEIIKLFLTNTTLPVNHLGLLTPNLHERTAYYKDAISLKNVLGSNGKNIINNRINTGDIVFILPYMYTGNTDFKATPRGRLEGGFLNVAIANSVLEKNWLIPIAESNKVRIIIIFIASFIACLCVWILPLRLAGIIICICTIIISTVALLFFAYFNLILFWLIPVFSFLFSGTLSLVYQALLMDRHGQRIASALEGMVSKDILKNLMLHPEKMKLNPIEIPVSIMFIDIEGFSLRAEIRKPEEVFVELREQFKRLADIVHLFGGVVDKTLGDGLLCYFGYSYGNINTLSQTQHAYDALLCAIEIQRDCANFAINYVDAIAGKTSDEYTTNRILPMRIGLNTGPVFFGNLGAGVRIDYTIVGDAVNFAKRLEDGCETFRIMLGAQTKQMLCEHLSATSEKNLNLPYGANIAKRLLSIKHHQELVEGWECDPFFQESEKFLQDLSNARKKIERNAQRWCIPNGIDIEIIINHNFIGYVRNFSLSGLGIDSQEYFAKKATITLDFSNKDQILRDECLKAGLLPLLCEVRWGINKDNCITHGVQFGYLNPQQREQLMKLLQASIIRQSSNSTD